MGKRIASVVLALFLLMSGSGLIAEAASIDEKVTDCRIEQVHAVMPQMEAYYYVEGSAVDTVDTVTASFAGRELQVTSIGSYNKKSGMDYYLLLDISASISKEYFNSIKAAIIKFQSSMAKKDRLTLVTFGDEVKIVFENKGKEDDCSGVIQELANTDMTTALFQAIGKTAELADKNNDENGMRRSVALVITDGEDFATNKTTGNEALTTLQETGLPVYSMAVDKTAKGADNQYINDFGEFTRSTGGALTVFNSETAWDSMEQIRKELYGAKLIRLEAANNESYQTLQPLTLTFNGTVSATIQTLAKRAEKDETIPVAEAEELSSHSIGITFSESVMHAETADNYIITSEDGKAQKVASAAYSEEGTHQAVLTLQDELYNGTYTISYQNICDNSAQENMVVSQNTVVIKDGLTEETVQTKETEVVEEKGIKGWLKKYWMILVAAVTILIVSLIVLIAYLRVKKNKGVVVVDGKAVFQNNVSVKQHVELEKPQTGHEIVFRVKNGKDSFKEIPVLVSESIFVGRSEICDLYFSNDTSLSKQHFAIEEGPDGFYIQDLQTTNGTMVNGVRIHQKRKLVQGDTINAGMVEMQVRW